MELFGSLTSISGAFTASAFSGSFVGDGSSLYNLQASGVTGLNLSQIGNGANTASVSTDGFQVNTNASITGSLTVLGTITAEQLDITVVSSSVLFQSGSTKFGDTLDDNHNITGSVNITGSISLNGQAIGTGKLDETTFYSYTSSNNGRVSSLETSTSSLNSFTNSINTTIKNKLNTENVISGSIQVDITNTTNYSSFSSSIATTNSNQESRLNAIEIMTNSLNNFSYSIDTTIKSKLNVENVVSGSGQITLTSVNGYSTFSSSLATTDLNQENRISVLETTTGSLNTFTSSALTRVSAIESTTSSLNTFTSSANGRLNSLESASGSIRSDFNTYSSSINSYTSSNNTRLNAIETSTGSLNTFSSSTSTRLNNIETSTSSINTFTSSAGGRLTSIETSTSSLNSYTSSTNTRLGLIETSTGSLNSFTNSINTTIKNKLNTENVISGSVQVNITSTTGYSTFSSSISSSIGDLSGSIATTTNGLSSSVAAYNLGQDNRLTSIEGKTGSYATTGSNSFLGTQNITGSLYISENLTVYGSSSLIYLTSSQLAVSSSFISVNVFEPAERFGGIKVYDSGSSNATASLAWDSLNNRWVYQNVNGASYNGAMLISGPRNTGSLGDEQSIPSGKIVKSVGGDHIDASIMNETSGVIYVTGSVSATGTVYGTNITSIESTTSSLNSYTSSNTTNINSIHTATSSLNSYTSSTNSRLTSIETSTGSLNSYTSSNTTNINAIHTATSSLNSYTSSNTTNINAIHTATSSLNTYTSSANTRLGLIETSTGSLNSFTNSINTTIKNKLNSDGVISGSSQVDFGTISNKPTLVSGSSQITYSGISSIPSGIVSGSSQVSYTGLSNIPSGIVSGSSQISFGSVSGVPSGIVSGSSQVSYTGLSNVPSGIVSGSAQLTSTFVQKAGDTVTGIVYSTYNTATGIANNSFSTAKTILGNIHIQNGAGSSGNAYQAAITFQGGTGSESQAGIYVSNNSSTGTAMGFATTDSYATGPILFMTATPTGVVNFPRARPTYNGNTILDAANYTSYAMAGAGYSANQNLNTSSTPTFTGAILTNVLRGGIGAASTTGTLNWNDSTNARSGQGYTLLLGNATNGPGPGDYFHPFSFEYSSWDGTGNMTQFAIPYNANQTSMYFRGRYGGTWGSWYTMWNSGNDGSGSGLDADLWDGYNFSDYLNQGVKTSSSPTFAGLTVNGQANFNNTGAPFMKWSNTSASGYLLLGMYDDQGSQRVWFGLGGRTQTFGSSYAAYSQDGLSLNLDGSGAMNISNRGSSKRINLNTGTEDNANFTTLRIVNQTVSIMPDYSGGTLNVNGNMVFNNQGSKITFGDSTSASPCMIGEGLVDTYGSDSDFLTIYARNSLRIYSTQTNEVFRFAAASNYSYNHIVPGTNNTYNLGSASLGWANVYTNDLHLSNMNKPEGNDIDGTNGDWTIQEGAENLYIINNNNGKKFKISLEEIK